MRPGSRTSAAYASAFYGWLISSRAALDKALPSTEATAKARGAAFAAENHCLQGALTKAFYKVYDRQMSAYDGDDSAPSCKDHDSQVLLCLFPYPDAWLGEVQASAKAIGAEKATLTVNLPKYDYAEAPSPELKVGEAHTIFVTLVVDNGVWKFDKVADLAR